ncbi:MAG: hypothetical protein KAR47_02985, partial [Planctomycetes bacterium]|nr:hypothetical protein [Planctomycetota bacterium]
LIATFVAIETLLFCPKDSVYTYPSLCRYSAGDCKFAEHDCQALIVNYPQQNRMQPFFRLAGGPEG